MTFPNVYQYPPGADRETPEGYIWMALPDLPGPEALLGGHGLARALVCARCGAFVALRDVHDSWHEGGA